jgi:undecaprenyl-diphosphatase
MAFLRDDLSKSSYSENLGFPKGDGSITSLWMGRLYDADLAAVRFIARSSHFTAGRACAIVMSKLGNGWIYLIIGALVFEFLGYGGFRVAVIGGLNALLLHCLYPYIKRRVGRQRPFKADPKLRSLLAVLDEHSFPSGHVMTLSGVLIPIVLVWPATAMASVALMACMAWSRIATAHHYPSDIFAGTFLGVVLAYPLSICFLSVW